MDYEKIAALWQTAQEKGAEVRDAAELRLQLIKAQRQLNEVYGALGRLHYRAEKRPEDGVLASQMDDAVAAIDELRVKTADLRAQLAAVTHCWQCECGEINDRRAEYCGACGSKRTV